MCPPYERKDAERIMQGYAKDGVVGAAAVLFSGGVVDGTIDAEVERKTVALKEGFPALPATTCATILQGLNCEIQQEQVSGDLRFLWHVANDEASGRYRQLHGTQSTCPSVAAVDRRGLRARAADRAAALFGDARVSHRCPRRSRASHRRIRLEEEFVLLLLEGLSAVRFVRACGSGARDLSTFQDRFGQ